MNTRLVLRQQGYENFQGFKHWVQFVIACFLAYGVSSYFLVIYEVYSKFSFLPLASSLLFGFIFLLSARYLTDAKIEVDEFGLHYQSGLPELLQHFNPDWRISWGEIQEVNHSKNVPVQNQLLTPLFIRLVNKTIKLYPMLWVDPEDKKQKKPIFITRHDLTERYENNPLIKLFAEKGFLSVKDSSKRRLQSKWSDKSDWVDINSNPITLAMVIFFFSSIFYFLFEVYAFLSESYIGTPPYKYIVIAAVLAIIMAYLVLMRSKLMNVERVTFAILMGISMAAVSYPLLLRINQWTDADGLQTYTYTKKNIRLWEAENEGLPDIKFAHKSLRFWDEFRIGSTKQFEIRKGSMGFYQLNMKPIREEQRTFYRSR